jgi:hypothetical protein
MEGSLSGFTELWTSLYGTQPFNSTGTLLDCPHQFIQRLSAPRRRVLIRLSYKQESGDIMTLPVLKQGFEFILCNSRSSHPTGAVTQGMDREQHILDRGGCALESRRWPQSLDVFC